MTAEEYLAELDPFVVLASIYDQVLDDCGEELDTPARLVVATAILKTTCAILGGAHLAATVR